MNTKPIDEATKAAVNTALATLANEGVTDACAVIVIVRPVAAGERLGVASNIIGNNRAVATFISEARDAVMNGDHARVIEPTRRIVLPTS